MFEGFSPEAIDFLWGIRMNNERGWFQEHKSQYVHYVYEPMKALGEDLWHLFDNRSGDILKVSRIYRDARMHYAEPYKDSLWLSIRRDSAYWAETPCLFMEIRPEGISYGFSLWKPRTATMAAFRRRIEENPEEFLKICSHIQKQIGMETTAVCYKRPKYTTASPEMQRFINWKEDIACIRNEEVSSDIFGPALKDRVSIVLKALIPLYDYFNLLCSAEVG